jgi:predicted ribosome quality control (RQC) complex YloA/Tae2 family protein
MTPVLNWKELAALVSEYGRVLDDPGLSVDRVIVPERPRFPAGFVKSEWALRMGGRRKEFALVFSVRPRSPYLVAVPGKGPKAAPEGSHSPFSLALSKQLRGMKFLKMEAYARERSVVLWFQGDRRLGLVLQLIPAVPEALLIDDEMTIIARSRTIRDALKFVPPDGLKAPEGLVVREDLVKSAETFRGEVERALDAEAFELRAREAEKRVREALKQARDRIRQNQTSVEEALGEPDWRRYGELLKATLPDAPAIDADGMRELQDFESGLAVRIPSDRKLSAQAQAEKFFSLARRKQQREEQARLRIEGFRETELRLEGALAKKPEGGDWAALERFERLIGTPGRTGASGAEKPLKRAGAWLGKSFVSKDGLTIMVGRSRDENLELTFKHARGNDVWMHVRGRPGAHLVIPVTSGKSVPLETLLDAASLCIHYSGGEKWGKTEVDYTFKKYVKRIKDSTEASYTNNKTLIVEPDPARLKRLLGTPFF